MAGRDAAPSVLPMTLLRTFSAVLALDLLGLAVALATGVDDLGHALVVGTPINAPFTFVAVQALIVLAATRHRAGAAVLAVLCTISVVSGFSDGSYADDLSVAERAIQLALVAATVTLGALAARAALRPRTPTVAVG
jgi:hypothetical protein